VTSSMFFLPRPPRGVIALFLTVAASLTTLTVVDKCTTTHTTTIRTELPAREIAQGVHGSIVASAQLILPARETVIVHDTVATTRVVTRIVASLPQPRTALPPTGIAPSLSPSPLTRTASFRDSTFAGIISGVITAPPDPAPLGITYHVTRPLFNPTIAFITTTSHPLAVISWQGEHVTLNHVIFTPQEPRWIRYADFTYRPDIKGTSLSATIGVHITRGIDVAASVIQPLFTGAIPTPAVTVRRRF